MNEAIQSRNYYAIIPADVRYDNRLNANSKLLFAELTALSNEKGYAFASNKYFADLYNVDSRTIQRWLNSLSELKYISIEVKRNKDTKQFLERRIKVVPLLTKLSPPPDKNVVTPPDKNVVYNNKAFNNKKEYSKKNSKNLGILEREYTPEQWESVYTPIEELDF